MNEVEPSPNVEPLAPPPTQEPELEFLKFNRKQVKDLIRIKESLQDLNYKYGDSYDKTVFTIAGLAIAFVSNLLKDDITSGTPVNGFVVGSLILFTTAMVCVLIAQFCAQGGISRRMRVIDLKIAGEAKKDCDAWEVPMNNVIGTCNGLSVCVLIAGIVFFTVGIANTVSTSREKINTKSQKEITKDMGNSEKPAPKPEIRIPTTPAPLIRTGTIPTTTPQQPPTPPKK